MSKSLGMAETAGEKSNFAREFLHPALLIRVKYVHAQALLG